MSGSIDRQTCEAVIFPAEEPQRLRYVPLRTGCLSARSTPLATDDGGCVYDEGRDFVVDALKGTIARKPGGRIPDWTKHELYGKDDFDHRFCKEHRNVDYTVYVDYDYDASAEQAARPSANRIARTLEKLRKGETARYVVFGDSISTGAEASRPALAFHNLFAERIRALAPESNLEIVNRAIGGERCLEGIARYRCDVIDLHPDLVTMTFGANDQCRLRTDKECGVPPAEFRDKMRHIVTGIREETGADVVLITPLILNPAWMYTSGEVDVYAEILRDIARECGACLADLHVLWRAELDAGKSYGSLLMNNINHPNDYGHHLYDKALAAVL
jgi:lysophospholipase L1-like esterase